MFFVYLKDGRRVDIPEASFVIHRAMVVFLDRDDQIVRQIPAEDILAYSRTPYEGDVVEYYEPRQQEPRAVPSFDSELLMRPRHHRRRLKPVPAAKPAKPNRRVKRLPG
jgi:hypothetical protein